MSTYMMLGFFLLPKDKANSYFIFDNVVEFLA